MSQLLYAVDVALRTDMDDKIVRQEVIEIRADDEEDATQRALSVAQDWLEYDERIHPQLEVLRIDVWDQPHQAATLNDIRRGGFIDGWTGKPRVNPYPLHTQARSVWWDAYDHATRTELAARADALATYLKGVSDFQSETE